MIAFLLSRTGLTMLAIALVAGVIGVQTLRLGHAKHDLATARASLATSEAARKASEGLRAAEYQRARSAVSDAETACSARVASALKSGSAIRVIVSKPHAQDPVTHCPLRAVTSADELRHALQP